MSDLTAVEKRKLEKLFGMETGYVLDFSNRTFEEFIRDSTGLNIFDQRYNHGSGSKANRLRAFWQKEDNDVVGKLLNDILDYYEPKGVQWEICGLIVTRLLKHTSPPRPRTTEHDQAAQEQRRSLELQHLKDSFFELAADHDRNRAGLALELLLN